MELQFESVLKSEFFFVQPFFEVLMVESVFEEKLQVGLGDGGQISVPVTPQPSVPIDLHEDFPIGFLDVVCLAIEHDDVERVEERTDNDDGQKPGESNDVEGRLPFEVDSGIHVESAFLEAVEENFGAVGDSLVCVQHELLVGNLSILINVHLVEHFVELVLGEVFVLGLEVLLHLSSSQEAVSVSVDVLEKQMVVMVGGLDEVGEVQVGKVGLACDVVENNVQNVLFDGDHLIFAFLVEVWPVEGRGFVSDYFGDFLIIRIKESEPAF